MGVVGSPGGSRLAGGLAAVVECVGAAGGRVLVALCTSRQGEGSYCCGYPVVVR